MDAQTVTDKPKPSKVRKAAPVGRAVVASKPAAPAPVVVNEAATFLAMIERVAVDPTASVEKMEQLFALYQKVQADAARKVWMQAFSEVAKAIEPIAKDANNDQTGSKYASFFALDNALRPHYTANGFSITHTTEPSPNPGHILCVMYLLHVGGHERRYQIDMPADGKGPKGGAVMSATHATGGASTYGKRYNIGNAFNVVSEPDKDGNAPSPKAEPLAPDALEPISKEQVREIANLLVESRANVDLFLQMADVDGVPLILRKDFAGLKAKLLRKIDDNAKKGGSP